MADDLVRHQRVEMRIGDHHDLAVGRLERGSGGQFARLLG
jgi:hypothetical protein